MNQIEKLVQRIDLTNFECEGSLLKHNRDFLKLVELTKRFRDFCWLYGRHETLNIEDRVTGEVDPLREPPE